MPSVHTTTLTGVPYSLWPAILAGLEANYGQISAKIVGDTVVLASEWHPEPYLRSALASEAATAKAVTEAAPLRTALFDYLLG